MTDRGPILRTAFIDGCSFQPHISITNDQVRSEKLSLSVWPSSDRDFGYARCGRGGVPDHLWRLFRLSHSGPAVAVVSGEVKIKVTMVAGATEKKETLLCQANPEGKGLTGCKKQSDQTMLTAEEINAMSLRKYFPGPPGSLEWVSAG